jgi:hypothetical protein
MQRQLLHKSVAQIGIVIHDQDLAGVGHTIRSFKFWLVKEDFESDLEGAYLKEPQRNRAFAGESASWAFVHRHRNSYGKSRLSNDLSNTIA